MSAPERPPLPPRLFSNKSVVSLSRRTTSISNSAISKSLKLLSRVKKRLPNPITKQASAEAPLMERSTTAGANSGFDSQTTSSSSATFLFPTKTERTPGAPTPTPCRPNNPICYGLPVLHRLSDHDFCTPSTLQRLVDTGPMDNRNVILQNVIDGYNNEFSLICNLVCNAGA